MSNHGDYGEDNCETDYEIIDVEDSYMAFYVLKRREEELFGECPVCGKGYMVPTIGKWHRCSECGIEVEENEYGLLITGTASETDQG